MIEIGLEFDGKVEQVVSALSALPKELRPVYFSHDEAVRSKADLISNEEKFRAFVGNSKSGFFLIGQGITCSIRMANGQPLICDCFIDAGPELAQAFLIQMAAAQPRFGFACMPAERERRNRVTTSQGVNSIESWVGRNTQKYVPGLYWLTLLSEELIEQHGISLPAIEAVAQEHKTLNGGQHLFKFYQRPEDWEITPVVAELCATLPGMFNIEKVRPLLQIAKGLVELNAMLKNWK